MLQRGETWQVGGSQAPQQGLGHSFWAPYACHHLKAVLLCFSLGGYRMAALQVQVVHEGAMGAAQISPVPRQREFRMAGLCLKTKGQAATPHSARQAPGRDRGAGEAEFVQSKGIKPTSCGEFSSTADTRKVSCIMTIRKKPFFLT